MKISGEKAHHFEIGNFNFAFCIEVHPTFQRAKRLPYFLFLVVPPAFAFFEVLSFLFSRYTFR